MSKYQKKKQENFVWLSYADLSTGLMISFVLIFLMLDKENSSYKRDAKNSFDGFKKV
ncbi:MAG: hypothetical protein HON90_10590, partial [Halobacteriovoraceae bacterium]|nr:hypothetical protein [Halobacteriovoraceae bacterium]